MHNYLGQTENALYNPKGSIDPESSNFQPGEWRSLTSHIKDGLMTDLPKVRCSRYREDAIEMRNSFCNNT